MDDTPLSVRRFETLQIVSIIVGLINGFIVIHSDLFGSAVDAIVLMILTLQVSRRRKSWARWTLLAMLVLGCAFMVWNAPKLLAFGYRAAAVALIVSLMNAVAVMLLFTPESGSWFRKTSSPA